MPYHIKKPRTIVDTIDVYYKEGDTWTETYADRKVFSTKSTADALAATTVTREIGGQSHTYQPKWWKDSTVVTE